MPNKNFKSSINFIGNSAVDVTGSCYLIQFKQYCLLFDCGMVQTNDPLTTYKSNLKFLRKIKPTKIQYLILSHLHIDHSGMICALFAKGCQAHVYIPAGSKGLLKLLWADSLKIMQSDCLKLERKHGIKAPPLYSEADIDRALDRCIEVNYYSEYQINSEMSFVYYPAGHIRHSAQIELTLRDGNITKRIGYTGDIGGTTERLYTEYRAPLPFVDILIGENTYNTPTRPNKASDRKKDIAKIKSIVKEYNKILIPTFSLGRTQEILTMLYELNIDIPIYLDSPLSQKISSIWDSEYFQEKVLKMSNLHIIQSWIESQSLQFEDKHCIILAGSGFLTAGRSLAHLKTLLPNRNNHVIFCGYSGTNNLASQIKNGDKIVKVDGEDVENNANITCLYSFSSHASYEELMEYYTNLRFNKIAIVHGDYEFKPNFCRALQENLYNKGNSAKVVCVNEGTKIYL